MIERKEKFYYCKDKLRHLKTAKPRIFALTRLQPNIHAPLQAYRSGKSARIGRWHDSVSVRAMLRAL